MSRSVAYLAHTNFFHLPFALSFCGALCGAGAVGGNMTQLIDLDSARHMRTSAYREAAALMAIGTDVAQRLRDLIDMGSASASEYQQVLLDGLTALEAKGS